MNEHVIVKIKKLLARADADQNDNENERAIAMRQAHALLAKHGLEMADVEGSDAGDSFGPLGQITFDMDAGLWRAQAYYVASELNGCYMLTWRTRGNTHTIIAGRAMRATVARAMGAYIVASIEREAKARRGEFAWMAGRSYFTDFGNGAVAEVRRKVRQILADQARGKVGDEQFSGERALVLVDQHRAALTEAEALARREYKVGGARSYTTRHSEAYGAGREFGAGLSLNAQLGNTRRKQIGGVA